MDFRSLGILLLLVGCLASPSPARPIPRKSHKGSHHKTHADHVAKARPEEIDRKLYPVDKGIDEERKYAKLDSDFKFDERALSERPSKLELERTLSKFDNGDEDDTGVKDDSEWELEEEGTETSFEDEDEDDEDGGGMKDDSDWELDEEREIPTSQELERTVSSFDGGDEYDDQDGAGMKDSWDDDKAMLDEEEEPPSADWEREMMSDDDNKDEIVKKMRGHRNEHGSRHPKHGRVLQHGRRQHS